MNTEQLALLFLRKAARLNGQINKALAESLDLTAPQLRIMEVVAKSAAAGCTVNTIKSSMFDPMSNVSRMLIKLEKKALIVRSPSSTDQRSVLIQLTGEGKKNLIQGKQIMDAFLSRLDFLTPEEADVFTDLLNRIPN